MGDVGHNVTWGTSICKSITHANPESVSIVKRVGIVNLVSLVCLVSIVSLVDLVYLVCFKSQREKIEREKGEKGRTSIWTLLSGCPSEIC